MEMAPYLVFNGNCKEAFTFYQSVLGGELTVMTHAEAPMDTPPASADLVMHARLETDGQALMGSDNEPGASETPASFAVSVGYSTAEDAERVFAGLAAGGTVTMPIDETFWAIRFGMLTDKFGVPWMVNCDRPMER